jgi:hypothetical protein
MVLASAGFLAALAIAALVLGIFGGTGRAAAGHNSRGCTLTESAAGYPDRYITHRLPSKIHPPLPVAGWHGDQPLAFDVLFHSVFHGYLVITYRPDLPASQRTALRSWVAAHANERVVGTPSTEPGTARLDLAEWGWELRCDGPLPTQAQLDRFAARRPS